MITSYFFGCYQNADGSLPANETGDRISTFLFYVSTGALMRNKYIIPVQGKFLPRIKYLIHVTYLSSNILEGVPIESECGSSC